MKSKFDKPNIVAIAQQSESDGIARVIRDELISLGYHASPLLIGSPIPENAEVVFSFGPYGRFLAIPRQISRMPFDQKPIFIHWNTEGIPDPKIPWNVMSSISKWRSWFGRLYESREGSIGFPGTDRILTLLDSRMMRFRYVGDYYYAHSRGWLNIFADSSAIYAQFHRQHGLPTIVAHWGATPRWYADLGLERDIDVLWMGARATRRRSLLLDQVREELRVHGIQMHVVDGIENPFIHDEERTHYLNRSKITLNLTRTWYDDNFSRFAMAAPNRSLIVSETVLPHCPSFEPGVHYVSSSPESLPETILYYLEHESERLRIVESAYRLVANELTFQAGIKTIMESARRVYLARQSGYQIPFPESSALEEPL